MRGLRAEEGSAVTSLPRTFCPDCREPLENGQAIHGLYGEHSECHKARLLNKYPSDYINGHNAGPKQDPAFDPDFDPEWRPVPDRLEGIATGWLSPDGAFYGCRAYVHIALGRALARHFYGRGCSELTLEERGWGHVADIGFHLRDWDARPTQAQLDALFDWYTSLRDDGSRLALAAKRNLELVLGIGDWREG